MGDEYYLQPPKNQAFYRFVANMMSFFCVGNRAHWGYETCNKVQYVNRKITISFAPFVALLQMFYLYVNFTDLTFDILGILFTVLPVTLLGNKLIKLERMTRWTSYYLYFFFITSSLGWLTITARNNFINKELVLNHTVRLQTCLFLWMPFDYSYNYTNWAILHTVNIYIAITGVSAMMIFHSINYMFVYNVIGHIQILKNFLQTEFTDNLSDEEIRKRLGKIIKYNTFIINVFDDVQRAFGCNVAANYLQNLLGNSVVLYQLMYGGKENMMLYVEMIMAYTVGPIIMSFVLEEIRRQTDDLPDVVYNIPWQHMSVSNQKIVMLMLQRAQILMDFKALGGMKAGIAPMISILKTTFSYYVMLETSIENKN